MKSFAVIMILAILLYCLNMGVSLAQDRHDGQPLRRSQLKIEIKEGLDRGELVSEAIRVPIAAPEPFLAIGAVWADGDRDGAAISISLSGSEDGTSWSSWKSFEIDRDAMTGEAEYASNLMLFDSRTKFIKYRLSRRAGGDSRTPVIKSLRLSFISPGSTPDEKKRLMLDHMNLQLEIDNQMQPAKYPKPPIITRTQWGCPDGQITTHGTLSYTTVTHLIVHHTVNDNASTDWPAVVRSIWNFHVFDRGYADIGYNYLIDPHGVIYEGRAGGDNVQGAHFSGVNSGTMGVAMLGTFTDVAPSPVALTSLEKILAWKADQRDIDPSGTSLHQASGLSLKNISGHRDGPGATECPGNALYPLLPSIRTDVKNLITNTGSLAAVSAASFKTEPLARETIAAAFGTGLATATVAATSTPLPMQLAGTNVAIRDSLNVEHHAPLFFVSPGQINFLVPGGLADGPATIIVTNGDGGVSTGSVVIAAVAPALFSANADGDGPAAALILRVKSDGSQTFEPATLFDSAQGKFVTKPIDLGPPTDQVFLIAYGTGIRFRSALSGVTALAGGVSLEVLYAGPAAEFAGLDQLNLRLSRSLIGRGEIVFELIVDGKHANPLKISIM